MMPTLRPGDRVQADDAGGADPKRGEVWVVLGPPKLFPGGGPLVKRVIGLPGETVEVRLGRVLIDGRPIAEPYLTAPGTYSMPARRLGPGEYFVLGDSRDASNDSHVWGPAPRDQFLGRARLGCWPLGAARRAVIPFERPSAVQEGRPPCPVIPPGYPLPVRAGPGFPSAC